MKKLYKKIFIQILIFKFQDDKRKQKNHGRNGDGCR